MGQAIDTKLWNLLDMIRKAGFSPEEHDTTEWRQDWFIAHPADGRHVRVVVHPDDGYRVEVFVFDARMWLLWDCKFSNAPHSAIRATIRAAVNA